MRVRIYLTNGDSISIEPSSWSLHHCGALEIMTGPNYVPHTIIAPGQWTSIKFEHVTPSPEPEAAMP